MVSFSIDVFAQPATRMLDDIMGRMLNARPALEAQLREVHKANERAFETEGRSTGTTWAPNAPATIERKQRAGLDPKVLAATGALRRAATSRGPGSVVRIGADSLVVGTKMGGEHQSGDGVPKRPFLVAKDSDVRQWSERIGSWLVGGVAR